MSEQPEPIPVQLGEKPTGGMMQHMTLRDYFAGQALAGMFGRDQFDAGQATPEQRAKLAYIDADAMLAEAGKE